jgi:hypothetical protein
MLEHDRRAKLAEIRAKRDELERIALQADNEHTKLVTAFAKTVQHLRDRANEAREGLERLDEEVIETCSRYTIGTVVKIPSLTGQGAEDILWVIRERWFNSNRSHKVQCRVYLIHPNGRVAQRRTRRYGDGGYSVNFAPSKCLEEDLLIPAPEDHPVFKRYMAVQVMKRLKGEARS